MILKVETTHVAKMFVSQIVYYWQVVFVIAIYFYVL